MLLLYLKKIFIYCSALVLILPVAANAHAMTLAVEQDPGFCNQLFDVRINEDKLSLHADQIPLQCILRYMTKVGIKIRIDPLINPKISASFEDRDIQKGVDAILKPLSYILIWESIKDPLSSPVKLSEIRIFKPGNKELMRPLHSGAVLSIVRKPKDGSLFVKDEILLGLKSEINLLEFKRLLKQIGGRVVGRNDALGIYKIILPEDSDISSLVKQLINHPGVAKAEPNYAYPIAAPFKISAPVIPVSSASNIREQGGEVRIAILDTGLSHDSRLKNFVPASLDALNPNESISDSLGHGTQMSLIAAGVVTPYGVGTDSETDTYNPIIPVRVFDDNGFTSNFALIESIDFALNNGARVMSLSWGSEIRSDFLENTLDYASSKDLIIVAAAGNEPTGKPVYPAAYSSVIGIGALEPGGKAWENSNYGSFVMLYAPGFAALPVGYNGSPGTYAGTSISTAFTANIIADYLSINPDATKREVFKFLVENGVSIDR